ncbi:YncE family protein [Nocardia sp. NPDC049149]|uniref:YncE family protein n=1 Tax=Nocardia sp. NPDC049149 TaxID=3364315 RepID=UPI0037223A0A
MFKHTDRTGSGPARRATILITICATAAFWISGAALANPSIPGSTTGPDGPIFVPNYGTGSVLRIDPATFAVQQEIPNVGDHPMVIKALPDGSRMFVGNFGPVNPLTWNVSVIDMPSGNVVKRISTLGAPYATITLSRDARYLFVPTALSLTQVIDTQTLEVVRTMPILLPPGPAHIEVSPDGATLYVMAASGLLTKYDAYTGAILGVPLFLNGFTPGWGALSADGNTLYAINFWSGVTIVDVRTWTVRTTTFMDFWAEPISATLTPDGTQLWVCNYNSDEVIILDAQTGAELNRFPTNGAAVYTGFSPDGSTAYLTTLSDGVPLPYWNPLVGWYHAKQQAWDPFMANLANLDASLVAYDTTTLKPIRSYTTRGVFVAGAYPG